MWLYLKQLWAYAWLGKLLYSYQKMYRASSEHDCGLLEVLVTQVIKCGAVPIKFCQWFIPNLELLHIDENQLFDLDYDKPPWLKKLEVVYEGCPEHSLRFTYGEYRRQFGNALADDYQILGCIGSGSIGQVYKVRDVKTNQERVMKVRHPYVLEQIWMFDHLFRIVNQIICWYLGVHHWIPFNVPSFIKGFKEQSDFVQEANHLMKMKSLFRDNWAIRIPDIAKISDSILVMDYAEGVHYDELQGKSAYTKTKIFSIFYLFFREAMMVHDFNHGDLHRSNWKVAEADNPLGHQIILYDFGYCWSAKVANDIVKRCIDLFEGGDSRKNDADIKTMAGLLYECVDHRHIKDKKALCEEIDVYLQESPYVGKSDKGVCASPIVIYRVTAGFCVLKSILIQPILIQFVILYTQINKNCAVNGFSSITGYTDSSRVYKDRYLLCLNFCKTYKIFQGYQSQIEDRLNELQVKRESPFDFVGIPDSLKALALQSD